MRVGRLSWMLLPALTLACAQPEAARPAAVQATRGQALSAAALSEDFEAGLGSGWTAANTWGVARWHVVANPEALSVSPAFNPLAVTLADPGAHLAAAGGTHVAWFGNDDTGTYVGSDFPAPVAAGAGGTSAAAQGGTLTSPTVSLAGQVRARLEFDAWWEIEGAGADLYDQLTVRISRDGGPFTALPRINPTFTVIQPQGAAYSSGGPSAPPVWRHYLYELSAYAGSDVRIQFSFDSEDASANAYRGFSVDNVRIDGEALPAPSLRVASPSVAAAGDLVRVRGANLAQGAQLFVGSSPVSADAVTQLGADELLVRIPVLPTGAQDLTVVEPDGQRATLAQGLTISATASPFVDALSPATADVGAAQAVTLTGEGFASGATVWVGGVPATGVEVVSPTQLTATFPGLGAGAHSVQVVNPDGQGGTLFSAYAVVDASRLEVRSPEAGALWTAGSTQAITWTAEGTEQVGIRLYKAGVLVSELSGAVDAVSGRFDWAIPEGLAPGADYAVRLFTPRGTQVASSEGTFSILPAPIDTALALESSNGSAQPGEALHFTAAITPAEARGSVQFAVDGVALGGPVAVSNGVAVSAQASLAKGSHTVVASFTGTGRFTASSATLAQAVNTAPQAQPQAALTQVDTAKAITLRGTDADGDLLSFAVASPPLHGTLSGTPPSVRYTPEPGYTGPDAFTFAVNDGQADSATAEVTLDVGPRTDAAGLRTSSAAVGCSAAGGGSGSLFLFALVAAFLLARAPRRSGPLGE